MTDQPPTLLAPPERSAKRPKGLFWAFLPIGVFAVQGIVLAVTITFATGRGLDAVEPDYYTRSLEWDDEASLLHGAERLGWDVSISISDREGAPNDRQATIIINDREGAPVRGARVTLECFHHGYAGDRISVPLEPDAEVRSHIARVPMHRAGLWEFRVRVERGPERCLVIHQIELEG